MPRKTALCRQTIRMVDQKLKGNIPSSRYLADGQQHSVVLDGGSLSIDMFAEILFRQDFSKPMSAIQLRLRVSAGYVRPGREWAC